MQRHQTTECSLDDDDVTTSVKRRMSPLNLYHPFIICAVSFAGLNSRKIGYMLLGKWPSGRGKSTTSFVGWNCRLCQGNDASNTKDTPLVELVLQPIPNEVGMRLTRLRQ
jgi:hypothetical protein